MFTFSKDDYILKMESYLNIPYVVTFEVIHSEIQI